MSYLKETSICGSIIEPLLVMKENIRSRVIMIMDDDRDLLEMIDRKLHSDGFDTLLSLNGENFRKIIAKRRPDLILLDLQMQGIQGEDICHDIKSNPATASIPIIIFSGNANLQTIADECGADAVMDKPFELKKFDAIIRRFIPRPTG